MRLLKPTLEGCLENKSQNHRGKTCLTSLFSFVEEDGGYFHVVGYWRSKKLAMNYSLQWALEPGLPQNACPEDVSYCYLPRRSPNSFTLQKMENGVLRERLFKGGRWFP